MRKSILIIGDSGSGKSSSIRNLDPTETFIITSINKLLPFKGSGKMYVELSKEDKVGNYYCSPDTRRIVNLIKFISESRPNIKTIIVDDFQYLMAFEFISRGKEKGYEKYSDIGMHALSVIEALDSCRADLDCFVLSHGEYTDQGLYKFQTIGKLIDNYIKFEGLFSLVFRTYCKDGEYKFETQANNSTCKTPMGMFDDFLIDNDLLIIKNRIREFIYG